MPVDHTTISRALVLHVPSGDVYVVEEAPCWDRDGVQVVDSVILAATGALHRRLDLGIDGPLEPSAALFDRVDSMEGLQESAASWLEAEYRAGRLSYPIGRR